MENPLQHSGFAGRMIQGCILAWLTATPCWAGGTVDEKLVAGAEALSKENLDQAVELFSEAIDDSSATREQKSAAFEGRCAARYKKSLVKSDTSLTKEAVSDCSRSLEIKPDRQRAYRLRGTAQLTIGETVRALEDLNVAQALDPQDYLTLQNRGLAFARIGQTDRAIVDFNQAIQVKPSHPWSYYNRGRIYAAQGQNDAAVEDFSTFIRYRHDYEPAYLYRGRTWLASGAYQQALVDLHESLRLKPDGNAQAHQLRGVGLYLLERYDEALADFSEARQLDDGDVVNAMWMFFARERLGMPGREAFAGIRSPKENGEWPGVMVTYLMGRGTPDAVQSAARASDSDVQHAQEVENLAMFFMGELELLKRQPIQDNVWFAKLATRNGGSPWVHAAAWRTRDQPQPKGALADGKAPEVSKKPVIIVDPIITGEEDLGEMAGPPTVRPDSPLTSGPPIGFRAKESAGNKNVTAIQPIKLSLSPQALASGQGGSQTQGVEASPAKKGDRRSPHISGMYAFKLAAYESSEHADQALAEISRMNLPVYLQDFQGKDRTYLRVWVGPFPSEAEAMEAWKRVSALPGANPSAVRKR
ncbi:MAG: tetratricopeptide repeat protein [Magnetococcales bacterium]|nr:tetratricopeptide repeat protein [Magnetococcales bacterium]